ncbi:MAG: type II toxin-antitoxin system PemK/MazF family toxin [Synergistaceae bacterium]|nr:type II toxin-antitoxin system PemK/MazF family toxin [Synergistaceae bacterium]
MSFRQGDIVEVSFDPTRGHEPKKTRPALVVSNDTFNGATSMPVVCPITKRKTPVFPGVFFI